MTKKDYILIANVLRVTANRMEWPAFQDIPNRFLDMLLDDLCTELKRDNPAFNRDTFLKAVDGSEK